MQINKYMTSLKREITDDKRLATGSSTSDYPIILSCQLILDLPEFSMITLESIHGLFLELPGRDIILEKLLISCYPTGLGYGSQDRVRQTIIRWVLVI